MASTENVASPSIRKKMMAALFASQSLFSASTIASFTLMPIVSSRLGGSDSVAGVPATVTLLGRALAAYPAGWLMDRLGRRAGLSLGYLSVTVGGFLSVMSISPWDSLLGFCLGGFLVGAGRGVIEQARFVAAEINPPERRAGAIGLIVFAGTVGAIGGPLLVEPSSAFASAMGWDGYTGPYAAATVLTSIALLLVFGLLRPDPLALGKTYAGDEESAEDVKGRSLSVIYADGRVRLGVLSMVAGQFVMTLIMVITPLHMNHNHHGAGEISWVIMAHTLGMFGLSSLTGWLSRRLGQVNVVWLGGLVLAVSASMTPFSHTVPILALALFLLGLGWNFCFIAGSAILSDSLASHERGRAQGASEALVALAAGAGSLGTGVVFANSGILSVSALGLVVSVLLIGGTLWRQRGGAVKTSESGC